MHRGMFTCILCSENCTGKLQYLHHMSACRRLQNRRKYKKTRVTNECRSCNLYFKTPVLFEYHLASIHRCKSCNYEGSRNDLVDHLEEHGIQHGRGSRIVHNDIRPFNVIKAFKGFVRTYRHKCVKGYPTLIGYDHAIKMYIIKVLRNAIIDLRAIKSQVSFYVTFKRYLCDSEEGKPIFELQHKLINSNMLVVLNQSSIKKFYSKCVAKIENTTNTFQNYGSGWQLSKVTGSDIRIGTFRPFKGSCWIQTPREIEKKKCTSNIRNKDNQCFKWAALSA